MLIFGNHDKRIRKTPTVLQLFDDAVDLMTVKVADEDATDGIQRIVLCHYPMLVWDQSHRGAWHLHGHCHGTLYITDRCSTSIEGGRNDRSPKM